MAAIHQGRTVDELTVYEVVGEAGREVVRPRKVALGGVYNNQVEVLPRGSEVTAGSKVVISTAERLADGIVVRVTPGNTTDVLAEAK
jgi:hypothetical protein